jgi:Tfp pilus assembly protein PilF
MKRSNLAALGAICFFLISARAFLQHFMAASIPTAGVLYLASRVEDMLGNDKGRVEFEDRLIKELPTLPETRNVLGAG